MHLTSLQCVCVCLCDVDINECALNQDTCVEGQTCENTIGSFACRRSMSCGTGYTLDQATQQCLGILIAFIIIIMPVGTTIWRQSVAKTAGVNSSSVEERPEVVAPCSVGRSLSQPTADSEREKERVVKLPSPCVVCMG